MKKVFILADSSLLHAQIDSEFQKLSENLSNSDHKTLIMAGAEIFKMRIHFLIDTHAVQFPVKPKGGAA